MSYHKTRQDYVDELSQGVGEEGLGDDGAGEGYTLPQEAVQEIAARVSPPLAKEKQ